MSETYDSADGYLESRELEDEARRFAREYALENYSGRDVNRWVAATAQIAIECADCDEYVRVTTTQHDEKVIIPNTLDRNPYEVGSYGLEFRKRLPADFGADENTLWLDDTARTLIGFADQTTTQALEAESDCFRRELERVGDDQC